MWPFKRKQPETEQRSTTGYTAQLMSLREAYITGASGVAELSAVSQSCISLWENGMTVADVQGAGDYFTPQVLALIGRSLALRGEFVGYLSADRLLPCSDWDLSTTGGVPTGYRVTVPEIGGGVTQVALAAEIIHVRVGSDVSQPWTGQAPLKRASLTAALLQELETALSEVYAFSALGSSVVPTAEKSQDNLDRMTGALRGARGKVLMRESMTVDAAGGVGPAQDWRPQNLSPNLKDSMTAESLAAARDSICMAFGVQPSMFNSSTTGPQTREGQRHLATWTLDPICKMLAQEASQKLAAKVTVDCMTPLQAYDAGGRARAAAQVVELLARAKEAGVDADKALALVNWSEE